MISAPNISFGPLPDFSAVILDMDGLVLDTESGYIVAWKQAASSLGFELSDSFCRSLSGLHYYQVEQKLIGFCGSGLDIEEFNAKSGRFWRTHVRQNGIVLKKGFNGLIKTLNDFALPYCLATNSRMSNVTECLQLAGIEDLFNNIVTRDHVVYGKPAADIIIKAADLLDVAVDNCLVVEDSYTGILAAKNAGAFSVLIPSMLPVDSETEAMAGVIMTDMAMLADVIRCNYTK